eukprot:XP_001699804.1 predicted protein [Chlamydomonas reinhardtii]
MPALLPAWAGVPLAASRQDAAAAVRGRAEQLLQLAATSPAHHAAAAAALTAALALLPPAAPRSAAALLQDLHARDRDLLRSTARDRPGASGDGDNGGGGVHGAGSGNGGGGGLEGEPLAAALLPDALQLVTAMRAQGPSVLCPHDPTLPVANEPWWRRPPLGPALEALGQRQQPQQLKPQPHQPDGGMYAQGNITGAGGGNEAGVAFGPASAASRWPRVLVAANLRQAELLLPFWSLELLRAVAMMSHGAAASSTRSVDGAGNSTASSDAPAPAPTITSTSSTATAAFQGTSAASLAPPQQPLQPPQPPVAVSIYESGSSDATPEWLMALAALLDVLGVPNAVVTRGALRRAPRQHRIEFLASVRNQVLDQALLDGGLRVLHHNGAARHSNTTSSNTSRPSASSSNDNAARNSSSQQQLGPPSSADSSSSSPTNHSAAAGHSAAGRQPPSPRYRHLAGAAAFRPDRLLFLNDVYVCAPHLLRLLQLGHGLGADLTCGLDFDRVGDRRRQRSRSSRSSSSRRAGYSRRVLLREDGSNREGNEEAALGEGNVEELMAAAATGGVNETARSVVEAAVELGAAVAAGAEALVDVLSAQRMAAAGHRWDGKRPYEFYDIWVARDVTGRRFDKRPPIAPHHGPSALRLALGLPTAAFCCWNGAAVLNAAPFLPPPPRPPPTSPPLAVAAVTAAAVAAAAAEAQPKASAPGMTAGAAGGSTTSFLPSTNTTSAATNTTQNTTGGSGINALGADEAAAAAAAAAADEALYPQLRFRRSRSGGGAGGGAAGGECDASECSLLCHDLHRLGHSRVVVDPGVRLSYVPYHDTGLHEDWFHGAPMLTWAQLAQQQQPAAADDAAAAPPVRPRTLQQHVRPEIANAMAAEASSAYLTAAQDCVWLICCPPPHPPPQVTQLKLDLGGLWWQAARAGLTPPDIDAALAAGPRAAVGCPPLPAHNSTVSPRTTGNMTAAAAAVTAAISSTSAWAAPPPQPPLSTLRSCLEGEWAALARRVATPPPSTSSPPPQPPTPPAKAQQLQLQPLQQPLAVAVALAELLATSAGITSSAGGGGGASGGSAKSPAPSHAANGASSSSAPGPAPARAPVVLVRTLGPAYECINLVPSADVADFPGATLRDLAWPNHTAAYLEERRAEQRRRNAKDGSAATHN